jgi:proline dehydrogenase
MFRSLSSGQRVSLMARRRLLPAPKRTFRSTLTSLPPKTGGNNASFKDKKLVYAAGGTSLAVIGLLWTSRDGSNYSEDPRDVKALSTVPFTKLFSGWV